MKKIVTLLLLLSPLSMIAMQQNQQSQQQGPSFIRIRATLNHSRMCSSDAIIIEKECLYMRQDCENLSRYKKVNEDTAYAIPKNNESGININGHTNREYIRAHRLLLAFKSINTATNTIDIEYSCELETESNVNNSKDTTTIITTSTTSIIEPDTRSIELNAFLRQVKIPLSPYTLELSATTDYDKHFTHWWQ